MLSSSKEPPRPSRIIPRTSPASPSAGTSAAPPTAANSAPLLPTCATGMDTIAWPALAEPDPLAIWTLGRRLALKLCAGDAFLDGFLDERLLPRLRMETLSLLPLLRLMLSRRSIRSANDMPWPIFTPPDSCRRLFLLVSDEPPWEPPTDPPPPPPPPPDPWDCSDNDFRGTFRWKEPFFCNLATFIAFTWTTTVRSRTECGGGSGW